MKNNNKLYTKTVNVLTIELEQALLTLRADSEATAHLKAAIAALTDLLPPPLIADTAQIEPGAEIRGATATQDTMLVPQGPEGEIIEVLIDSSLGSDQRAGQ